MNYIKCGRGIPAEVIVMFGAYLQAFLQFLFSFSSLFHYSTVLCSGLVAILSSLQHFLHEGLGLM